MKIKENSLFLFQGDSITDAGRDFNNQNSLGGGYAMYFSTIVNTKYPERNIKFINKGIGGNRTVDLKNRWDGDCVNIKPDYISILIGINDVWRRFDNNQITTAKEFEENYKYILNKTLNDTNAEILMLEPFVLYDPADRIQWKEDLNEKIFICRKLAKEYKLSYIALDGKFAEASMKTEYKYWLEDGVHPTREGHMFIANAMADHYSV